jgi:hypothetical protein
MMKKHLNLQLHTDIKATMFVAEIRLNVAP